MVRLAVFVLLLFAFAITFAWLADNPGTVQVSWPWLDAVVEVTLLQAVVALAAIVVAMMAIWWVVSAVVHSPEYFDRWRTGRKRDKGYDALSRGLIAAGAGNAPLAHKLSKESSKYLDNEPLVALLDAQTALLEGKRDSAREKFKSMVADDETRLLGLRGLYVEAEREGEFEAASMLAEQANEHAPGTPWAAQAVLKSKAVSGDWELALKALERNQSSNLYEKEEYKKKRAVILTALAQQEEGANPDAAKAHALAAHKIDPSLVPAATTAARLLARLGDLRKAAKVLETAWKQEPHPEIADTYMHLRSGDSTHDRLEKAETLAAKRPNHIEGSFAIAKAAIDAGEWAKARDAMEAVLRNRSSERACLMMADIEEAEHGDRGRVREWLARAVHAPRDAAWTADGVVAEEWAAVSPVTGQIGAFEWKVPVEQLGGPDGTLDYSKLAHEPPKPGVVEVGKAKAAVEEVASTKGGAAAGIADVNETKDDDIEDAVIVDADEPESAPVSEERKPTSPERLTPYKNTDLDDDHDGVIDRKPDDPGPSNDEPEKKKAMFF